MKTPISYYGGKQQLLPTILPLIPAHRIYTEAFFGGGAVYWAKEPAEVEAINDYNGNVVNFYRVLKTRYDDLNKVIKATLHSRETHKHACTIYALPWLFDELTRAWAFWAACHQGFHCMIGCGWTFDSYGKKTKGFAKRTQNLTPAHADRLRLTTIEQRDANVLLAYYDTPETFHYIDPPYLNANQGHYGGYTEAHFKTLLNTLSNLKGKFLLSTYPHELLDN
jgi:DNA adenine methylase